MKSVTLIVIIFLFLSVSCSHWSLTDKLQDANGNVWLAKGAWGANILYYCNTGLVNGVQKDEPACYEAGFYKFK